MNMKYISINDDISFFSFLYVLLFIQFFKSSVLFEIDLLDN